MVINIYPHEFKWLDIDNVNLDSVTFIIVKIAISNLYPCVSTWIKIADSKSDLHTLHENTD